MREISEQDALERLRARISYGMRIKTLAAKFGVSQAFMSMVLAGKKRMTEPMLRSIGVERKVTYLLKESNKAATDSILEEPIYKKAFALGAEAASNGLGEEENPYDAGTRRHAVWLLGYQSKS